MALNPSVASSRSPAATKPQPLLLLNYLFYAVLVAALAGFLAYLYSFRAAIALYFPLLLQAAGITLSISGVSMVLGSGIGVAAALCRLSDSSLLRQLVTVYVEVIRGTPTLVQLLFWGFGIGAFLAKFGFDPYQVAFQWLTLLQSNRLVPANFSFIFYGILGLSFNNGAYLTEIFRAGIESVPRGQTEAALSLGMSTRQTLRRIILPQAVRNVIPPYTNNFINLVQDSALLSTLGVVELEQTIASFAYPQTEAQTKLFIFVLGALFFLAICYPLSLLTRYLERQLRQGT